MFYIYYQLVDWFDRSIIYI